MAEVKYIKFYSHILNRDIDVEITGHWGYPILMFPTSGGSFVQNRDFGLNDSVEHFTNNGMVKLYNIQTIDMETFYARHYPEEVVIHNYEMYMQFLVQEFVPYMQRENDTHRIGVAGCSFGGFHAANFAFRFPDLVSHMFSMSGAFSIRNFLKHSKDLRVYYNCPEEFMANAEGWKYNHMEIVLGTSEWDVCLDKNRNMAKILYDKGIRYWWDEKKFANHDWPLWNEAFPQYLAAYFG